MWAPALWELRRTFIILIRFTLATSSCLLAAYERTESMSDSGFAQYKNVANIVSEPELL